MVPEKGAHKEELDERLVEARDEVLVAGEKIIAQEVGDQGQAIVLTDSRIIIVKAGITATGQLNGRKTGIYPISNISQISLRKGPMGGVIMITGEAAPSADGSKPENIVVFSVPDRIKRCDAVAAKLEEALGRPIERIGPASEAPAEPKPEPEKAPEIEAVSVEESAPVKEPEVKKPRGGRVAKSLAEEMFGEAEPVAEAPRPKPAPKPAPVEAVEVTPPAQPQPVKAAAPEVPHQEVAPPPVVVEPVQQMVAEPAAPEPVIEAKPEMVQSTPEVIEEPEEEVIHEPEFRPNPKLPKPTRRKQKASNKVLVLVGGLMAMVLVGVAVTSPLRQQQVRQQTEINVSQLTNSVTVLSRQYRDISEYRDSALAAIKPSNTTATAVRAAIGSGNHQSVMSAISKDVTNNAWQKISELNPPLGLAGAKETMVSGLFIRKNAIQGASTGSVSSAETARKLAEADSLLARGAASMDKMLKNLESRMGRGAKGKPVSKSLKVEKSKGQKG